VAADCGVDVAIQSTSVLIPHGDQVKIVDGVGDSEALLGFGLSEGAKGVSERMVRDALVGGMV
jgi:hypothetical protein